jgi:cytochrome c peroxidase
MAAVGVHSAILGICLFAACESVSTSAAPPVPVAATDGTRALLPLPEQVPGLDAAQVKLGHLLFEEPLLSADGTKKCTTCHPLREAGMDAARHSIGVKGQIWWNTPTVYNVAFSYRFNWRGQFRTVEDELDAPLLAKAMGNKSWADVVDRQQKAGWDARFREAGF